MNDKYIKLITDNVPGITKIEEPKFSGMVHPVFIVTLKDQKKIFRFSDEKCAKRNQTISGILKQYNIHAPEPQIRKFGNDYCEIYPFIDGTTLYERVSQGMSPEQIDKVYKQIVDLCFKFAEIPTNLIPDDEKYKQPRHKLKLLYFKIMNLAPEKVYHQDLNPKNIILDKNDNLYAVLDLDAITKAPLVLAFIDLMRSSNRLGYSPKTIKKFCPDIYNNGKMLNLEHQLKLFKALEFFNKVLTGRYFVAKQRLLKNKTK